MSVAAFNKFALLGDDADDSPTLVPAQSKSKTASPAAAAAPPAEEAKKTSPRGGPASRSGRYYQRGGGPRQQADSAPAEDGQPPRERFDRTEGRRDREHSGRGRGEHRGRGRGGAFNKDRHSRTAIVDSDKQVKQGWGDDSGPKELAVEVQGEADAAAEAVTPAADAAPGWGEGEGAASWGNADDAAAPAAGDAAPEGEGEKARPVPEEDNTMTLDEYLAKKTDSALSGLVGEIQGRKANEGAGEDLFKDAQKLVQAEEEAYFAVKTKSIKSKAKKEKDVVTIEIDGQFSEPPGGGRGGRGRGGPRGGRGDFRGGRGRGEFRGRGRGARGGPNGASRGSGVNVDDQVAFPTLG